MLFQRWSDYIANCYGGNKELIVFIEEDGFDYVKRHFQYAILENYSDKAEEYQLILAREIWWEESLQARILRYNSH